MARKMRKILSLVVALCLCVGVLPLQALAVPAADTQTSTEVSPEGLPTEVTTTTTTETDEAGKTTVTVTIQKDTDGTTEDGVTVDRKETETTTTVTEEDGAVTEKTSSEGSETKEWTEDVQPGQEVPDVEVTVQYETDEAGNVKLDDKGNPIPKTDENGNILISGSVAGEPVVKTEGDTTTTTTTDREVNGSVKIEEEFVIVPDESKLECPVGPEDYAGKEYNTNPGTSISDRYFNDLLPNYNKDSLEETYVDPKPDEEGYEKGFDLTWTGYGDVSNAASAVYAKDIVYLTDENGEIVYENGFPVVDMEKTVFVNGRNGKSKGNGMVASVGQFALKHENGEYFYAYCMDASTGASPDINKWYNIRNLEDAIESEENPDGYLSVEDAGKIRAIATHGYWGTESGRGSVDDLKELLRATYGEDDIINVRYPGSNEAHPYKIFELIDGLTEAEALTVTQAAIWTYANNNDVTYNQGGYGGMVTNASVIGVLSALKCYNGGANGKKPSWLNEYVPAKKGDSDARLQALYYCLLNLDPIYADGELREDSTVIPNEGVMSDVALVIKDKVADDAANLDDNTDNDVYNTELNFKLAFIPGENDEMYVCLMDTNNQPIMGEDGQPIRKLLASENSTKTGDNVIKPVGGVYTLTGLKLSENSNFEFDLRLEGTQYLNEGVYIYQAEGGRAESQTLVGLAKGEQKIEVSNKMSITFDVDESSHVVAERVWYNEGDPQYTPGEEPEPTEPQPTEPQPTEPQPTEPEPTEPEPQVPEEPDYTTPIPDTQVPYAPAPAVYRLLPGEDDTVTIEEEEVPLADTPETGDMTALWIVLIVAASVGLCVYNVSFKKQKKTF